MADTDQPTESHLRNVDGHITVSVRVPCELHRKVAIAAQNQNLRVSDWLRIVIARALEATGMSELNNLPPPSAQEGSSDSPAKQKN